MITTPYDEELSELQDACIRIELDLAQLMDRVTWYTQFDAEDANRRVLASGRSILAATTALNEIAAKEQELLRTLGSLLGPTQAGLDPRYWFSSERAVAKRRYEMCLSGLNSLRNDPESNVEKLKGCIEEQEQLRGQLGKELQQWRSFDIRADEAKMAALKSEQSRMQPELARLHQLKKKLDIKLVMQLDRLQKLQTERHATVAGLVKADEFEQMLADKSRRFPAYEIHAACEKEFGYSSPRAVRAKLEGSLTGIEGEIGKLDKRIRHVMKWAQMDVRKLIVDGNNLCYQGGEFIGLGPLKALASGYGPAYEIILVFDATIRRRLSMLNAEIRAQFPALTSPPYVVASRRGADETILALAEGQPHTFVISNDKYSEYPDRDAVMNDRVIRHEIVDNKLFIHELDIDLILVDESADEVVEA